MATSSLVEIDGLDLQQQQPPRLKIASKEDLVRFLREILPTFLRVVDPRESGFLDSLYASFLLTETDNESMSGKDVVTRKAQARKLWALLNKLPVDEFMESVAPELCAKFPHIIPKEFILTEDDDECTQLKALAMEDPAEGVCIHHEIRRRIRAVTLADLLYNRECLDFDVFQGVIFATKETEHSWGVIFEAFRISKEKHQMLAQDLKNEMTRHHVRVPQNISDVMSRGFACTCGGHFPSALLGSDSEGEKVKSWLTVNRFSSARSSNSSLTRVDASRSVTTISTPRQADSISLSSDSTLVPRPFGTGSGEAELEEAASKLQAVALTSSSEDVTYNRNAEVHSEHGLHLGSGNAVDGAARNGSPQTAYHSQTSEKSEIRLCFDNAGFVDTENNEVDASVEKTVHASTENHPQPNSDRKQMDILWKYVLLTHLHMFGLLITCACLLYAVVILQVRVYDIEEYLKNVREVLLVTVDVLKSWDEALNKAREPSCRYACI